MTRRQLEELPSGAAGEVKFLLCQASALATPDLGLRLMEANTAHVSRDITPLLGSSSDESKQSANS